MKRSSVGGSKLPTRRQSSNLPTPSHGNRRSNQNNAARRSRSVTKSNNPRSSSNLGARSSSNLRTPLSVRSQSMNRASSSKDPVTPVRFQGTAKKSTLGLESSARRISTHGPTRGWKETRPLSNKEYQRSQIKRLLDFLREHRFKNEAMTSKHFPLSSKDFAEVFNFLYSFLNPAYPEILPLSKYEEKIIGIMKTELNYPGQINRTHVITMGSLHSWPTILGCLLYVLEMVKRLTFHQDNIIPMAFPSRDSKGFAIDRESKAKINIEHNISKYVMWMGGNDDTETMDAYNEHYRCKMMEYYEVDIDQINQLQDKINREAAQTVELDKLRLQAESYEAKANQLQKFVLEYETRIKDAKNSKMKHDDLIISLTETKERNGDILAEIVTNTPFSLPSTEIATDKMAEDLLIQRDQLKEQLDQEKKKKAVEEAEYYHSAHQIETHVKEINRFCAQQEWDIHIPMPDQLAKGAHMVGSTDLSQAIDNFWHHMKSSQATLSQLENRIKERKETLKNLQTKKQSLEFGISKIKDKDGELKLKQKAAEDDINRQIADTKEQLVTLFSQNKKAKDDLSVEVVDLKSQLESKLRFNQNRKHESQAVLEQMITKLKETINQCLRIRDDTKKAVDEKNREYLRRRGEVLSELDAIEQEINSLT